MKDKSGKKYVDMTDTEKRAFNIEDTKRLRGERKDKSGKKYKHMTDEKKRAYNADVSERLRAVKACKKMADLFRTSEGQQTLQFDYRNWANGEADPPDYAPSKISQYIDFIVAHNLE